MAAFLFKIGFWGLQPDCLDEKFGLGTKRSAREEETEEESANIFLSLAEESKKDRSGAVGSNRAVL